MSTVTFSDISANASAIVAVFADADVAVAAKLLARMLEKNPHYRDRLQARKGLTVSDLF